MTNLRILYRALAVAGLLAGSLSARSFAAEPPAPRLLRAEPWSTVFAEEELKLRWKVDADAPVKGRLVWALLSADRLPLARGETANEGEAPEFVVKFPAVKPGVVLSTILTVALLRDGERESVAKYEALIHVFPQNPFYARHQTLKDLKVTLYDPRGATVKVLENAEFPFEQLHNVAAVGELKDGILLVGEGISLREDRGLPELMLQAAARGVPVICLAPVDGELELPRADGKPNGPLGLAFEIDGFILRLDKRLDERWWREVPLTVRHTFHPGGRGAQIAAEVIAGAEGWRWIDVRFAPRTYADAPPAENPTRVVVTALPLIELWEAGPTPRFLFARLLDDVIPIPARIEGKAPVAP